MKKNTPDRSQIQTLMLVCDHLYRFKRTSFRVGQIKHIQVDTTHRLSISTSFFSSLIKKKEKTEVNCTVGNTEIHIINCMIINKFLQKCVIRKIETFTILKSNCGRS